MERIAILLLGLLLYHVPIFTFNNNNFSQTLYPNHTESTTFLLNAISNATQRIHHTPSQPALQAPSSVGTHINVATLAAELRKQGLSEEQIKSIITKAMEQQYNL